MSDASIPDLGKFVPGIEFLQSLVKGASRNVPPMTSWVTPTLDPAELDRRINDLKTVQFWLDQNATTLKATIQAMEVQRMTLATLKGMNLDLSRVGEVLKFPASELAAEFFKAKPAAEPVQEAPPKTRAKPKRSRSKTAKTSAAAAPETPASAPAVDPMQLWGALTQQFQNIASGAVQEVGKQVVAASAKMPVGAATKAVTKLATKTAVNRISRKINPRGKH